MHSRLKQIDLVLGRLDDLLTPRQRANLETAVKPWLKRYRASGGRDEEAYAKIVAVLRRYPPVFRQFMRMVSGPPKARATRRAPKRAAPRAPGALARRPGIVGRLKVGRKGGGGGFAIGFARGRPVARVASLRPGGGGAAPRAAATPGAGAAPEEKPGPRWILANVHDTGGPGQPIPAFKADSENEVRVMIGAERAGWLIARGTGPSESIDAILPKGAQRLTVVFFLPTHDLQRSATLVLPPEGPTKQVSFRFHPGPAKTPVHALISILHRGRVLQTALLAGEAVPDPARAAEAERVTLRLQVVVPRLDALEGRQAFDAALVTAKDAHDQAVAAGVAHSAGADTDTDDRMVPFTQPRIDGAARRIRDILTDVITDEAADGRLDSEAGARLLWSLAQQGRVLYEAIGQRLEEELRGKDLSQLQLVQTDPGAFIPIEFSYDLPAPANGAGLCRNWKRALAGEPCGPEHHEVNELGHLKVVCPSGFWSVSKVIERQIVRDTAADDLDGKDFGVRAEPDAALPALARIDSALLAWSAILDNSEPHTSDRVFASLRKATDGNAARADTWIGWAKAIKRLRPGLLVLLSHTVNDSLEIGREDSGERVTVAQINSAFVKKQAADTPIVFLFGCDTAVTDDQIHSFVGRFREQGAALVVGTITPVLGERSARVVQAIVAALARKRRRPEHFGAVMRDARRRLLAMGELTALCATSFGDASWLVR